MKAVILAGGLGTRLSEETHLKPKPMVEIGGKPILWHIMKIFSYYGINDFIICTGYKGEVIKNYFQNYPLHQSDITFDLKNNSYVTHQNLSEDWKVTVINTGENTMTGGRLLRIRDYIDSDFCFTYGDGLTDVNINKLIEFHKQSSGSATLTSVLTPERYGLIESNSVGKITRFREKPKNSTNRINGGYFVLSKRVFDYIENDETIWEKEPLMSLASDNQLFAYNHDGFWYAMDKLSDKLHLDNLWNKNLAPWKVWG